MKYCLKCGKANRNENLFCSNCASREFGEQFEQDDDFKENVTIPDTTFNDSFTPPPGDVPPPPYMAPVPPRRASHEPIGFFDVLSILGFVSAIVGLVNVWVILEPLAIVSSLIAFFKCNRFKGLAAAGIVIAIIAFLLRLFFTLYDGNIIGRWAVEGVFR